jgi:membrane-bound inhibitor of C-type lysozyme
MALAKVCIDGREVRVAGNVSVMLICLACAGLAACGPATQAPPPQPTDAGAAASGAEAFNLSFTRAYVCANGERLSIQYRQNPHEVRVSADGGLPTILKPSVAAAGARYTAAGASLHTKGAEVVWAGFMQTETRCTEVTQ